jgi:hypothetical protein
MDNNNDNDAVMDDDDDQDRLTPRNMEVDVPKSDSMSFATSTSVPPHKSKQITNDFEESLRNDLTNHRDAASLTPETTER